MNVGKPELLLHRRLVKNLVGVEKLTLGKMLQKTLR
jgi:hypothetical protein